MATVSGESGFRTFSDSEGREMEAKLTLVSGDDVYIERIDGLTTKVDIGIFSEDDQKFIRDWERKQVIKDDAIEVRFTTEISNKSRWENSGGGLMRKRWNESYGIVLQNSSHMDIKNIRVEDLIFKFEDAIAAQKRSEGEVKKLSGSAKVAMIKAGEEATVVTEDFPMLETKLAPGYYWIDGGKDKSEDEMRGIWVRVYAGDILATELSKPENLSSKERWPKKK